MIDETKAAKPGPSQPASRDSSVWMKYRPWNACSWFSIRPYRCVAHARQAWRWIRALPSTPASFWAWAVTASLSRGTTPTTENSAPAGFQHLVQPQAWLNKTWVDIATSTGSLWHRQRNVPPAKPAAPRATPLSTDG